jgi:hypothetical protein
MAESSQLGLLPHRARDRPRTGSTAEGAEADFELYNLRVDVVGPPNRTIYCGARIGDYFELHREMLKLPHSQGFSIDSLAATALAEQPSP